MIQTATIKRSDVNVLLRIVGSRTGATPEAVLKFERSHHSPNINQAEIDEIIQRLAEAGLVTQRDGKYFSSDELQQAFLDECRNCRDTVEEFDILCRIIKPSN